MGAMTGFGRADAGRAACRPAAHLAPLLVVLALTGCSRPTGDFDRAAPSVMHDTVLPAAGDLAARYREEPVSTFNLTDDEKLLRDLGWGLIRPPWTKDWIGGTLVELTRTRILPEEQGRVPVVLYSIFLNSEKFRSSNARYDRIAADARGDAKLVMPFCEVARRVEQADEERLRALNARPLVTEEAFAGANARVWENRTYLRWVSQALRFRIKAYQTAVDQLEIETPSGNRVWDTNTAIKDMEKMVRLAEEDCVAENRYRTPDEVLKSRILTGWSREQPPLQK
ncbi:hypothetical protein [Polymorphum gilvum]|uniref:Uncharacterized protein n=1 Tax=Polymorphum gilvum (strain LMG 25793 / CGMCC 1.9160 / SL003B-26A1) TaxID=991905 RepID=F2IV35_POLGS|nr:hypothetical protein [Polymorphum gilvum]ADZ71366.1 hypothetical protein SL003B_2943 [Polymorphum gilvum SL003B-26A1]